MQRHSDPPCPLSEQKFLPSTRGYLAAALHHEFASGITFGETRQLADFLAFLGMQRGRTVYAVTGENLLSHPRLGCHPHGITKSDTGGELVEGLGYRDFTLSFPTQNIDFMNSPPVSKVAKNPDNFESDSGSSGTNLGDAAQPKGLAAAGGADGEGVVF
jgi:hypothetical protein